MSTIHRGTVKGGGLTKIGSQCLIMAYAHIAHDCFIGDNVIMANAATLAGHVTVEDWAVVGALCSGTPVCDRSATHSYVGGGTTVTQNVMPFAKTCAVRDVHAYGANSIGLERRGFSKERVRAIQRAFRILLAAKLNTTQALERIEREVEQTEDVKHAGGVYPQQRARGAEVRARFQGRRQGRKNRFAVEMPLRRRERFERGRGPSRCSG